MPELPEVETSKRGIEPFIKKNTVKSIIIRNPALRWPIPPEIKRLEKQRINEVQRRGKYILLESKVGTALLHLGMSGRLHIIPAKTPVKKHDHVDIVFKNDICLRFNDPRRFGCLLWTSDDIWTHPLLCKLGPEPLAADFHGDYLYGRSRRISRAVKLLIMDSQIVVGVGNIYASEALFLAGIDPRKKASSISKKRYERLAVAIKEVLNKAIAAGGTTLKDFQNSDGKPGYFQQQLNVYGREGAPCSQCQKPLTCVSLGQRSTFYCNKCQC